MSVLAETATMTREDWLQLRRQGLGGSDAAAIVGANPHKSKLALYLEKIGELDEEPESEAMTWGSLLEPVIADRFAEVLAAEKPEAEVRIRRRNAILQHRELPFVLGNVDRVVTARYPHQTQRSLLEIKTTGAHGKDDWAEGTAVPTRHYLQVQHYLSVAPFADGAYIAVLIGGQKFHHMFVQRNQRLIDWLLGEEASFWRDHVEARVAPAPDGSYSARRALEQLYPESKNDLAIDLDTTEAHELVAAYQHAKAVIKAAERDADRAAQGLMDLIGEAGSANVGPVRIDWKTRTRAAYSVQAKSYRHFQIYGELT